MQGSCVFQAHLRELDKIMAWVREGIQKSHLNTTDGRKVEIAIEEAVVNVIHYAYGSPPGLLEIKYQIDEKKHHLIFELRDQGVPFNPIEKKKEPNPELSASDREIGGLGIYFMCEMVDQVHYKREGETNVLTLVKSIISG
jgi:anti-sigma regulatory factor (Ser/Thr protein kinase)